MRIRYYLPIFVSLSFAIALWMIAAGQQAYGGVRANVNIIRVEKTEIPRGYKSWSLFLVTNRSWLRHELSPAEPGGPTTRNADLVLDLYRSAQSFGRVIGEDHLAVWFWRKSMSISNPQSAAAAENVDVERAIAFCGRLKLAPSEGPYLLFTTTYPDETTPPSAYTAIALGQDAARIDRMLTRLGDQLVIEGVIRKGAFTQPSGTDAFWNAWFGATRRSLATLGYNFPVFTRTPRLSLDSRAR
jgi:hypothetical protein